MLFYSKQFTVHNFLTTPSTRQVLQTLVLSHLDYCSIMWSGATKKDLGKLQLAQNRAARLALGFTWRANISNMHVNLSCLKVEERLTSSLLLFMRGIDMLTAPSCLSKLLAHSSDTPQDMPQEVSSQFPSPEQTMGGTQY